MAQPIEQWFTDIPPVTRAWVAAAVGTSILVVGQIVAIHSLLSTSISLSMWDILCRRRNQPSWPAGSLSLRCRKRK